VATAGVWLTCTGVPQVARRRGALNVDVIVTRQALVGHIDVFGLVSSAETKANAGVRKATPGACGSLIAPTNTVAPLPAAVGRLDDGNPVEPLAPLGMRRRRRKSRIGPTAMSAPWLWGVRMPPVEIVFGCEKSHHRQSNC